MPDNQNPVDEYTAPADERFELIARATHDIFWDWNLETNQIWRNEGFEKLFGSHTETIEPGVEFWYGRIHPDDKERVVNRIHEVIEQGSEWSDEYRFRLANGTYAHVYDRGFTIRHNGKTIRMVGAMTDLSERVRLQQAQQEKHEDWRIALESAELGTWNLDPTNSLVKWDERSRSFFGYSKGEFIHLTELLGLIHPDDRAGVDSNIEQALQAGLTGRFDRKFRVVGADDGRLRWIRCHGKLYVDDNGRPYRLAGTLLDITEDRRRETALRNAEKRFQTAFDNASVGIVISEPDGTFIEFNKAFCQMTGYAAEELHNNTFTVILHPDELPDFHSRLQTLLPGTENTINVQRRWIRKDGSVIWTDSQTTISFDEAGKPESLFSIIKDITADVALRDEQQKLLKLVENSQNFMAIATLDGQVTYVNRAGRELVGLAEADLTAGKTVADFYAPDHFSFIRDVAVPTVLEQGHWSGQVVLRHFQTDEPILCHASGIRIDDPRTGKPIGRGFTMRDLRPELAAEEAQRKLLTLVDNSVELMSILELDGKNSYLNKAGMDMLGFDSFQQVQETPIAELHAPEHFSLVEQDVLPSVMNLGRWSGKMLVRNLKTSEIFPVFNNTIRIDDPDSGKPIAIGAVMRDMRPELATQQALMESEERFRGMIMQAPVAITLLRGDKLVFESANDYMLNLLGRTADIIGLPLADALPEIEEQGFIDLYKGVYTSGNPYYGYETPVKLYRNGQLDDCFFNFVYAPVRDTDGSINGVLTVATEVTPQVKAKKELEESEKRFRHLVLDAPFATAVYAGPDMVIQLANDAMLKLWGKDASAIGKKLRHALPELEGQPFHQLLADVYTTGVAYQATEDRADLVIDGVLQSFYFTFTYKPLHDADGNVYAILNMAVDVTHHVLAKQQLQEAQESLSEAVDLAELATWTINLLTGEMTSSDRVKDWLGTTEAVTPELISRCIHEKDRAQVDQKFRAAMHLESGSRMDLEYTVVNQLTGQEHILRTQARVLFNEQDVPYLLRGTSQDITAQRMTEYELENQVQLRTEELKKSNLQLQQSNQELERYAYVASHDLQEPLRKIQLYASLLSERLQSNVSGEDLDYLTKMQDSANRMSVLIKNILDFSRISQNVRFVRDVNLTETVTSVLKDFDLLLSQKNARVTYDTLCTIDAIPLQMTQLFHNLISNALKFVRDDVPPAITISSRQLTPDELAARDHLNQQVPHCEISVADNGIGFDPAFAPKIFGLFQRLHHRQRYEGTGIGLALCQRIVVNHQGEIWAESAEGQGATFRIILPMRQLM
ncbi:PAS/PAC sensor signal transduction histidine kinase [Fibrisoma limi BUZ 3]|uniref:histidine kinase n=1 Tax=Fibrisoma limi BUZ 3 TaxID=1185876 RepID=I2GC57_9BACT|nr:PAS domain S-box protein [Fibrisoma limi]CCH51481.1 PAS/PAC sensor signal transduction histidine kinase [Fibrisoma limi BUZ 3]